MVSRSYDLVITGGWVVDPAHDINGPYDLAIAKGKVVLVSDERLADRGCRVLDAEGLWVLPGLVDLHTHCSSEFAGQVSHAMLVRAGVTTALDLAGPVTDVMEIAERYGTGLTFGCLQRLRPGENLPSSDPSSDEIERAIEKAITHGALGVKILGGHFPLTPEASADAINQAGAQGLWVAFHCGTTRKLGDIEGLIEALELRGSWPIHIPHINTYCQGRTDRSVNEALLVLRLLEQTQGVFTESYLAPINGTWASCRNDAPESLATRRRLAAGHYAATEAGLVQAIMDGYAQIHVVMGDDVDLLSGSTAVEYWREHDTRVGVSFRLTNLLAAIILACARRADGLYTIPVLATDGGGIPRNDTLRLGYHLVSLGLLTIGDLVRKASWLPAQYLGLHEKGHLGEGADADLVLVRTDTAEVEATVCRGQLGYYQGRVARLPTQWLTTPRGKNAAADKGLVAKVVDPFAQGLYGEVGTFSGGADLSGG